MSEMSHITQNYYFYEGSQKVDHIDKQEFTYNIYRSAPVMGEMEDEDLPMVCEPLVDALAPIFYGDREETRTFLSRIKGAKPMQVVSVANTLLQERKISEKSCNKTLWEILHDHGFYDPNLNNWNRNIVVPTPKSVWKNSH